MQLHILSPFKQEKYEQVEWVELQTDIGSFVIQEGHAPTILMLQEKKPIIFKQNKKVKKAMIQSGIADITREQVTILIQKEQT